MPRLATAPRTPVVRPRNDPRQYDDLAALWWDRRGPFAMLHWIARARAAAVPAAPYPDAPLLDAGCGGGLLAPHLFGRGYRHVGVDLSATAVGVARSHGLRALRADVRHLPFPDASMEVVVAGEILEHVAPMPDVVSELCRVLAPGGRLVIDTIAAGRVGRVLAVTIAERIPGGPPPRLHDPALFIDREELLAVAARHGVSLRLRGLRPSLPAYLGWLAGRRDGAMVSTRATVGLFQAVGRKQGPRS